MQLLNINESELLAHPLGAKSGREGLMFCCCCFYTFNDFYKTNYLNIYRISIFARFAGLVELWTQMNDLKLFFSISQGTLRWQQILWAKSTSNPHLVLRMAFARAAPPAYNKKGNCHAGRRQTNYLIRWTQENQLSNRLTMMNRRLEG